MKKFDEHNKKQTFFMHPAINAMALKSINGFSIDRRTIRKQLRFDTSIHFHKYFEIEFIFRGSATHYLNGKSMSIGRGYFYLLTPNDFHTYYLTDDEEIQLFNISFTNNNISNELLSKILNNIQVIHGTFNEDVTTELFSLFEMLLNKFKEPSENFGLIQRSLLDTIIAIALENLPQNIDNTRRPKTVNRILIHIEKNFLNPSLSLTQISEELNKTPNYLGATIKKYTGMYFNQYITQKRLDYASNLLKNKTLTINQVATFSGFLSTSYFIKLFKKEYGITPTEYISFL